MGHRSRCGVRLGWTLLGHRVALVVGAALTLAHNVAIRGQEVSRAKPVDTLEHRVESVLATPGFQHGHWGILVVDRKTGQTVYDRNPDLLFAPASVTKLFSTAAALVEFGPNFRFQTPLFRRGDVDANDVAIWPALRMPVGDPESFLGLIGALAGDLDAGHGIAGLHDRAHDTLDRRGQCRNAFPDRAPQMILNRDAANFREALIDLQIAAVGRKERKADRRRVVDQLQRRLLRKLYFPDG